jgi:histidinol-phosphatase
MCVGSPKTESQVTVVTLLARHPFAGTVGRVATTAADDLVLALALADAADVITMARFGARDLRVTTKPDLTPVSEADTAVEAALRSILAAERPGDAILGEEQGGALEQPGRRWVIDPIDGTKNYVRGVPVWATLIALVDGPGGADDSIVLGVVSAPALVRRWWARRGAGAWTTAPGTVEPRRITVSSVSRIEDASFSYSDDVGWDPAALAALRARAWRSRAYGDFWSHVLVAEGAADVAAEPELSAWDIAALIPIVAEAGGRVTAYDGTSCLRERSSALSTNGVLHDAVLDIVSGRESAGSP